MNINQVIQEEFTKMLNEQRPRRGIETSSAQELAPSPTRRTAETTGTPPPPEVTPPPEIEAAAAKPDPYAEPKWDPDAMQRHHAEAALYDDLSQWGGKGRFKHHAPSALSTRDIEGAKTRWRAGMEGMSRPGLTDAQKRKVFRSAMSKAGQIGGEGTWDRQRSMGYKGGARYHRINSMPFSNLVTGLSKGQKNELHKNLAKSGYWKKMHPSNPIRQDFEKSHHYKAPKKRRRRKIKKGERVGTWKTGKPMMRSQVRENQSAHLNQIIQEEFTKMLNEEIQQEELPVIYRIQGFIDFLDSKDAKLVGPDEVMWRQDPRYPATKTTLRIAWQAYKKEKFNL